MPQRNAIDSIFSPSDIAVIGASGRRSDATGNHVLRGLKASRFAGRIHVVNPSGDSIEGFDAVTNIAELPPVDVAVVAVNPARAAETIGQLADAGCRAALVLSVGLGAAEIAAIQRVRGNMTVHGPNCMGVIDAAAGVVMWADDGNLQNLPAGDVALISQSGSGAIFVARTAASVGFSRVYLVGQRVVPSTADYLERLADDPQTNVIGLVLESIADTQRFAAAARKVLEAGKRVVVLKVGRSAAGGRATVAHTGAILSDHGAYTALFESVGISVVDDYDELSTTLEVLSHLHGRPIGGNSLGVVTIFGRTGRASRGHRGRSPAWM